MTDALIMMTDEHNAALLRLGNCYVTLNPAMGMHASELKQMVYDLVCLRDNTLHVDMDVSQLCAAICAEYYTSKGTENTPSAWLHSADFYALAQRWQQVQKTAGVRRALCGGVLCNLHTPGLTEIISDLRDRRLSAAADGLSGAERAITGVAKEQEEQMREFATSVSVIHAATKRMHEKSVPSQHTSSHFLFTPPLAHSFHLGPSVINNNSPGPCIRG